MIKILENCIRYKGIVEATFTQSTESSLGLTNIRWATRGRMKMASHTADVVQLLECLPNMHKNPGSNPQQGKNGVWWHMPVITALRR